jgi:hypothetical protein
VKRRIGWARPFAAALWALCAAAPAQSEWSGDAAAAWVHDSNITNDDPGPGALTDRALELAASYGPQWELAAGTRLHLTLDATLQSWQRHAVLSNVALGATAAIDHKTGFGAQSPHLTAALSWAALKYNDDLRDGWRAALRAGAWQRLSPQWTVAAEVALHRRRAAHDRPLLAGFGGRVFDLASRSAGATLRWDVSERTEIAASYTRQLGDETFTSRPEPDAEFDEATAVAADPVFGAGAVVQRYHGASHIFDLSISQALQQNVSLNVALKRQLSRADAGDLYGKSVFTAAVKTSF